jgi:enterochelin esterase-like enzyme
VLVIHRHTGRMPSRRAVLLGGAGAAAAGLLGVGAGVYEGALPGRPQVQDLLGLNGTAGKVPDVEPADVEEGSFVSARRGGVETGFTIVTPLGVTSALPVVVALHGRGSDHRSLVGPKFRIERFLEDHVERGGAPFAIGTVDGGQSYWHERPDGEDAGAMVVEEFLPLLAERGLRAAPSDRIGLLGWSMGGYGALRLGGLLGAERVAAVTAVSPAMWKDPDDASRSGFRDAAEYEAFTVQGHQDQLAGIPVRIDCGTGDQFYRAVEDYVAEFPDDADVVSTFEPGAHHPDYWRRMMPAELDFLGEHVTAGG